MELERVRGRCSVLLFGEVGKESSVVVVEHGVIEHWIGRLFRLSLGFQRGQRNGRCIGNRNEIMLRIEGRCVFLRFIGDSNLKSKTIGWEGGNVFWGLIVENGVVLIAVDRKIKGEGGVECIGTSMVEVQLYRGTRGNVIRLEEGLVDSWFNVVGRGWAGGDLSQAGD